MNKLNPIEDNIIEKDQSKQTPAKFELNNHQINRLKSGKILNNKKISFKFNEEKLQGYEGDTLSSALLANNKIWLEDLLSTIDLEVFFLLAQKSLMHYWKLGKMNTKNQM